MRSSRADWLTPVWMYMFHVEEELCKQRHASLLCVCVFDCVWSWEVCRGPRRVIDLVGGDEIELRHWNTALRSLRRAWLFECDMLANGLGVVGEGGKKWAGGGLGWAFFPASLSSLQAECLSPPPPLFELLALGQVTKQDSITGRWNPKWPRLPPYVCSCECVSVRLSPVPVIYPKPSLLCSQCVFFAFVFACLLHPSKHTFPLRPLQTTSHHTHSKPPYVWSVFLEPLLCQQPTFCALAVGESDLNSSPLCLPLDTVDNCRL